MSSGKRPTVVVNGVKYGGGEDGYRVILSDGADIFGEDGEHVAEAFAESEDEIANAIRTCKLHMQGWDAIEGADLEWLWDHRPERVGKSSYHLSQAILEDVREPLPAEETDPSADSDDELEIVISSSKDDEGGKSITHPESEYHTDRPAPEAVTGMDGLMARMKEAETARDWSFILNDHLRWGNYKIDDSVAIFNIGSAIDCVNRGTERCQVGADECYAVISEKKHDHQLAYNRRSEYLWDCLDAITFAEAFQAIVDRKRSPVTALRFNASGDVRHRGDVLKMEWVSQLLGDEVAVYTYTASGHLDWSVAEHVTVNRSDPNAEFGDGQYMVVDSKASIPDDVIHCPFDAATLDGRPKQDRPKCGECRLCIDPDTPDIAVVQTYGNQFTPEPTVDRIQKHDSDKTEYYPTFYDEDSDISAHDSEIPEYVTELCNKIHSSVQSAIVLQSYISEYGEKSTHIREDSDESTRMEQDDCGHLPEYRINGECLRCDLERQGEQDRAVKRELTADAGGSG